MKRFFVLFLFLFLLIVSGCRKRVAVPGEIVEEVWRAFAAGESVSEYMSAGFDVDLNSFFQDEYFMHGDNPLVLKEFSSRVNWKLVSQQVKKNTVVIELDYTLPDPEVLSELFLDSYVEKVFGSWDVQEGTVELGKEQLDEVTYESFIAVIDQVPVISLRHEVSFVWEDGCWKLTSCPFPAVD